MLKNYIKIAFRKLKKNKLESLISIGGLAVGIACCILLMLSVRFEWTYDDFHENRDRIFRLVDSRTNAKGEIRRSLIHPFPMATALDSTFPAIERTVRLTQSMLKVQIDAKFYKEPALVAGPAFFQIFSFPLQAGDEKTALSDPNSVVLSESMAKRLYGDDPAIGKTMVLKINGEQRVHTVTGIAKEVPANSSITFDIVVPFEAMMATYPKERRKTERESWHMGNSITWVLTKEKASQRALEETFPSFLETHYGSRAENITISLQPLEEVYFSQFDSYSIAKHTDLQYTLILVAIALVILGIAGFNFIGLTLSRISSRHNELGIRKAAGALKKQLSMQMIGEIFITSSIALLIGMGLAELLAPYFRELTQKPIHSDVFADPIAWLLLLSIIPITTLITGIYPAYVIFRRNLSLLIGSQRSAGQIPAFVKGLVVVQFALSIIFLVVAFSIQKQINFLSNKDLGLSPTNVIAIESAINSKESSTRVRVFRQRAEGLPAVQQIALTNSSYNRILSYGAGMATWTSSTTLEGFGGGVRSEIVDEHFFETLDIDLIKGHNFSMDRKSSIEKGILVNEQFAEVMGWEDPVGKTINDNTESWQAPLDGKKVLGVIGDYHFQPLYSKIQPLFLRHINSEEGQETGTIVVKVKNEAMGEALEELDQLWNELFPQLPFNYAFLDELLESQYKSEQRWSLIMKLASGLAVLLACFGLFGLATLVAQRRTKEIGIRKALGASVLSIVSLLSKDFLKLVLLGFVIAVPVSWYLMSQWLQRFAYKIEVTPVIFLMAGGGAMFIALFTVSWQSIRAALANPVESLRSE
ncbi:ABC transporter permease [Fodinibius salsisoli]|uniref:ABC transporter permease n=1 Tax=Fodinibius salsisoli TaxID=2820877 RepID=A0ABT3PLU7_9BACT|nr:ABC transporter permease [Fodinibius salsisoli]MCW9706926.1 ABC transporter permease [Fodinibius salsisoli]